MGLPGGQSPRGPWRGQGDLKYDDLGAQAYPLDNRRLSGQACPGGARVRSTRRSHKADDVDRPTPFGVLPARVALAAVDWCAATKKTTARTDYDYGFDPFLVDTARTADAEGCDTIVYSLWSHNVRTMGPLHQRRIFGATTKVRTVFLEVADLSGVFRVEVWRKGRETPHRFRQRFSTSAASATDKRTFMDGLPARSFKSTLFLTCGEANIISTQRDSPALTDPFGFMKWLAAADPKVILNPSHDYMRRPEMKVKRALYSKGGRVVLSVWNRGNKPPEAAEPWQAFVDGREVSDQIREVPFPKTKEVRIGVFDLGPYCTNSKKS
jgi:hypothetical protein